MWLGTPSFAFNNVYTVYNMTTQRESLTAALGLGCTLELWPDASSLTIDCFSDDESTPEQRYCSDAFTSRAYHGHAAGLFFSLFPFIISIECIYKGRHSDHKTM